MAMFSVDRGRIMENLYVRDILVARHIQFAVSMSPTFKALKDGKLDSLRPFTNRGVVFTKGRFGDAMLEVLGVDRLPILMRSSRLATLIMIKAHEEDHQANSLDALARSRRSAWIVRGRSLAKLICKSAIYACVT